MNRVYPSIKEFYVERGGEFSPESAYGVHNWNDEPPPGCGWCWETRDRPDLRADHLHRHHGNLRVSHVAETGDFYAYDSRTGEVRLLGTMPPGWTEPQVYEHFEDWAQGDGPGRSLSWFRDRIAAVSVEG